MKLYAEMTADEQLTYLSQLTEFVNGGMVTLTADGCPWDSECRKEFEVGLSLLEAHPRYGIFVEDSKTFGDYARRIDLMKRYVNDIKTDLAKRVGIAVSGGQQVVFVQTKTETRRRGRPSREEMLREAQENANGGTQDQQSALTEAVAALVGATVVQSKAERELNNEELAEQRRAKKAKAEEGQLDLFQQEAGESGSNGSSGSKVQEGASDAPALLPLRQIAHLLKANEAAMISDMKEAYNTLTVNSETAKAMSLNGGKDADIAVYTNAAHDAAERIATLKHQLDIAMRYALYHTPQQLTEAELATLKAAEARLKEEGNTDTNETNKSEEEVARDKELKKKVSAILKYLRRTDKPNTEARIKGMEKKLAELTELVGEEEAKKYLPLLEDAKKNRA